MTLGDRLIDELRAWGNVPMSAPEIARRVKARDVDVLDVLRSDPRFVVTARGARKVYSVGLPAAAAPDTPNRPGRAGRPLLRAGSQCARILAVLEDGVWHTTAELYERCGGMVLHSRISELRKRGFPIEHEHVPGETGAHGSRYRLLSPSPRVSGAAAPSSSTVAPLAPEEAQLSMEAA